MEPNGNSLKLAESNLGRHRHICAFFNSFDEQHRVIFCSFPRNCTGAMLGTPELLTGGTE